MPLSEETKKKISIAKTGRKHTEEHKNKNRLAQIGNQHAKGYKRSEELNEQVSKKLKGRVVSDETRRKLSNALRGRVFDDEWRRKLSEGHKGQIQSEESRAKNSAANKGRIQSEESKRKRSVTLMGHFVSQETKNKIRDKYKPRGKSRDTSIELKVMNFLDTIGVIYVTQYKINQPGLVYFIDIFLPDYNSAIECDGDYWHSLPSAKARDERKNGVLNTMNIPLIRLREHEINNSWELVMCKIKEFIEAKNEQKS